MARRLDAGAAGHIAGPDVGADGGDCRPGDVSPGVVVTCDADHLAEARVLAARLGLPFVGATCGQAPDGPSGGSTLALRLGASGLSLVGAGMELLPDLGRMLPRLRPQSLARELLVRAARVRGAEGVPTAIDATAGLGEDSLLLAASGFEVTLVEHDPIIAALLADELDRARLDERIAGPACHMRLVEGESAKVLGQLALQGARPDVVLLDPMFPARRKSASVRKKPQLLQRLERPCTDEEGARLLEAALAARPRKVVVKRPAKGPWLGGRKPSHSIAGKAVRYDCYVVPR